MEHRGDKLLRLTPGPMDGVYERVHVPPEAR